MDTADVRKYKTFFLISEIQKFKNLNKTCQRVFIFKGKVDASLQEINNYALIIMHYAL